MDRYSELEVKYAAPMVPVSRFIQAMGQLFGGENPESNRISKYHQVIGWDTFYANPNTGLVLRYRRAKSEGNDHPVLTFKKRKSEGQDSVDRHEVDLFLELNESTDGDAKAFVAALGCEEHFSILKESTIFHITFDDGSPKAIVALYDVMVPPDADGTPVSTTVSGSSIFRFLEIEIDKDCDCTPDEGVQLMSQLETEIEARLPIGKPIGKSLYELVGPLTGRGSLYVHDTF